LRCCRGMRVAEPAVIGDATLYHADMRDAVPLLTGIDAVVTDPPYHLTSIVKRFGAANAAPAKDRDGLYARASKGFMGKQWDGGDVAFRPETWRLVYAALKPGAHLIAFSGTRTYHRMACAIEDAGFEIRDQIGWLYGSGFPKSHNAGNGWGTALKPAWEPIVLARKPLIGTVAENVLQHGTGAINVDACRVAGEPTHGSDRASPANGTIGRFVDSPSRGVPNAVSSIGRWPANVIHDGSEEVLAAFPDNLKSGTGSIKKESDKGYRPNAYGAESRPAGTLMVEYGDSGSAARFFYSAKADAGDRLGSKHPTVKPIDLMAYLCRLITPPGGTVLDPFAGSGTTGMAAIREGFKPVLIEREAEYFDDACNRIRHIDGSDTPLFSPQPATQEPLL
jgi:site-specific DNA-methyltransferase (adenine-specific)